MFFIAWVFNLVCHVRACLLNANICVWCLSKCASTVAGCFVPHFLFVVFSSGWCSIPGCWFPCVCLHAPLCCTSHVVGCLVFHLLLDVFLSWLVFYPRMLISVYVCVFHSVVLRTWLGVFFCFLYDVLWSWLVFYPRMLISMCVLACSCRMYFTCGWMLRFSFPV